MLKSSGHIALPLEESFLDFSALDTKDNQELDEHLRELDYGFYRPAEAVDAIKPLLPLSLKTPMERKACDDARFETFRYQKDALRTFIKEKKEKTWADFFREQFLGVDLWAREEVHTFRQFLWDSEQKSARKKFDRLQLPPSEQFVYLVKCYLANGISVSSGTLFFTQRHLIFVGKAQGRDTYSQQNYSHGHKNLRVTIPLRNVLSFHRAKLMIPAKAYPEHFFVPSFLAKTVQPAFVGVGTDEEDEADSVMVFTNDNSVHLFYGFDHFMSPKYNDVLAVFEHTWRSLAKDTQTQNDVTPAFTIEE